MKHRIINLFGASLIIFASYNYGTKTFDAFGFLCGLIPGLILLYISGHHADSIEKYFFN